MGYAYSMRMTREEALAEVSAWVGRLKKESGLTLEELADRVGVHRVTVSSWVGGKKLPNWQDLRTIEREFGRLALVAPSPPMLYVPLTPEAREIAQLVDDLPKHLRAYIRDAVYRLLGVMRPPKAIGPAHTAKESAPEKQSFASRDDKTPPDRQT